MENWFGRMCSLLAVTSSKFRWCEKNYDTSFRLCAALKIAHISWHLLRNTDLEASRRDRSRVYSIGEESAMKCKRVQERSGQRRRQRLDMALRTHFDFNVSE